MSTTRMESLSADAHRQWRFGALIATSETIMFAVVRPVRAPGDSRRTSPGTSSTTCLACSLGARPWFTALPLFGRTAGEASTAFAATATMQAVQYLIVAAVHTHAERLIPLHRQPAVDYHRGPIRRRHRQVRDHHHRPVRDAHGQPQAELPGDVPEVRRRHRLLLGAPGGHGSSWNLNDSCGVISRRPGHAGVIGREFPGRTARRKVRR